MKKIIATLIFIVSLASNALGSNALASNGLANPKTFYLDVHHQERRTDGSSTHPFKAIDPLMKAIEQFREKEPLTPITVIVRKGVYPFDKGYLLNRQFNNLTIKAEAGEQVIFSGGIQLPPDAIKSPDGQISQVNLKPFKMKNYGRIHSVGFARPSLNAWTELFVNGQPMHLSRWPNKGMIKMGKVIETGAIPRNDDFSNKSAVMAYDSARISSWQPSDDKWMSGYFHHGYADDALRIAKIDTIKKQITTDGATLYGFNASHPWNKWYAFNIKEETDEKGEFFIDASKQQLYFVSPDSTVNEIVLSQLEEPFFSFEEASDITLQNITFEYSRAALLSLVNSTRITIENCTFRNSGQWGILVGLGIAPFEDYRHEGTGTPIKGLVGSLDQHLYSNQTFNRQGGKDNLIKGCHFYNLGSGGISLGGGDRLTLEAGNNTVRQCTFHDNNRIERSYRPHIYLTGVGNKVVDCELYNAPSMVMLIHGNNHLIEHNYIHHAVLEADDQGAIYYGRNPSECGSIIRNNIFTDIPSTYSTCAIYHDDGAGGLLVEKNVFYRSGRYAVLLGGGSDNRYVDNTFIDLPTAIHIDNRLENWSSGLIKPGGLFEKRLREVRFNEGVYAQAYPYLIDYLPYTTGKPQRNAIVNNLFIDVKQLSDHPEYLIWENNRPNPTPKIK